jgi:hypothetical protein
MTAEPTNQTAPPEVSKSQPNEAQKLGEAAQKAEPAKQEQKQEAVTKTVTAPSKTYTEDEVTQRINTVRGGHEGVVKKMRGDVDSLTKKLTEAQEMGRQMEYTNWMRALKETGADGNTVDIAEKMFARDKQTRAERAAYEKEKAELLTLKAELDEAGKMKFVHETMTKYGLPSDYLETLSGLEERAEIQAKAADLALERAKTQAVPAAQPDKGEGKPAPRDFSKMPENMKLGILMEESLKK